MRKFLVAAFLLLAFAPWLSAFAYTGPVILTTGACLTGGPVPPTPGTILGSFPVNLQTGTTYAIVSSDRCKFVKFSNAAAVAATLPGTVLPNGWATFVEDRGAGGLTITPSAGQIDGGSSVTLARNVPAIIFSDGSNYHVFAPNGSASACSNTNNFACLNLADQLVVGGANMTSLSQSTGNITVDCGARPGQYIANTGAFTITAPSTDGYCYLDVENGAGAGAISLSGFSPNTIGGAAPDTTNGHIFRLMISRVHTHSNVSSIALQ